MNITNAAGIPHIEIYYPLSGEPKVSILGLTYGGSIKEINLSGVVEIKDYRVIVDDDGVETYEVDLTIRPKSIQVSAEKRLKLTDGL